MSWKPLNTGNCEYKKRIESLKDKLAEFRDRYLESEVEKLKHLAETMTKANEHRKKQNAVDT